MRGVPIPLIITLFLTSVFDVPSLLAQAQPIDTNLRGVSAADFRNVEGALVPVVWASGSNGVILRSINYGSDWQRLRVAGGDDLDFRSIQAFDDKTAYVMSSGEVSKSKIFKTTDGGQNWTLQFTGQRDGFFLDALVCSSRTQCFALSDPVDGKFLILTGTDGEHWTELPRNSMPAALPTEGAFAASGTCLAIYHSDIYFVTGGPAARLFHSPDLGRTWSVIALPIVSGDASSGAFSVARRGNNMVVVGGDYKNPARSSGVAAFSSDSGRTWKLAIEPPQGYRSAVAWSGQNTLVSVGPAGQDVSTDGGVHWKPVNTLNMNALATIGPSEIVTVGPKGAISGFSDAKK
jgi:photosystem II stability/assembly factor-like uncharacterized protein